MTEKENWRDIPSDVQLTSVAPDEKSEDLLIESGIQAIKAQIPEIRQTSAVLLINLDRPTK